MKKLLLAAFLLLSLCGAASAQCNGVFSPGQVCGNNTAAPRTPFPISALVSFFVIPSSTTSGDLVTWGSTTSGYLSDQQTIQTSQAIVFNGSTQSTSEFTFTGPVSTYTVDVLSNYLYQGNIIGFPTVATSLVYPSGNWNWSGSNSFTGPLSANIVTLTHPMSVAMGGTGGTNFNTGAVVVGNGTGQLAEVLGQPTGQCLLSTGFNTFPAYAMGCRVLLNTFTIITSTANIQDTTDITSTYNDYEIVLENVVPASSASTLEMLLHSSGSFQATNYNNATEYFNNGTTGAAQATTFIQLSATSLQSNTPPGLSGTIRLYNPTLAISSHIVSGQTVHGASTANIATTIVGGNWNGAATSVNGFEIIPSTSGILSAVVKVYGIQ